MSKRKPGRKIQEMLDYDYLDKLSPEELEYLRRFNHEFYGGRFGHKDQIHPTDKRRDCYAANNARERDIWNKADRLEGDINTLPDSDEQND